MPATPSETWILGAGTQVALLSYLMANDVISGAFISRHTRE